MNAACRAWLQKPWKNPDNKCLCEIAIREPERFKLLPNVMYSLDRRGLNHLEILSLNDVLDKPLSSLPTADIDNLNLLEQKYGILFNGENKIAVDDGEMTPVQAHRKPIDHMLYGFDGQNWLGCATLACQKYRSHFYTELEVA